MFGLILNPRGGSASAPVVNMTMFSKVMYPLLPPAMEKKMYLVYFSITKHILVAQFDKMVVGQIS